MNQGQLWYVYLEQLDGWLWGTQTGRDTVLKTINRMPNQPGLPGPRGFLECETFSVNTKNVLENQEELITLDINEEFCADHVYQTPIWR